MRFQHRHNHHCRHACPSLFVFWIQMVLVLISTFKNSSATRATTSTAAFLVGHQAQPQQQQQRRRRRHLVGRQKTSSFDVGVVPFLLHHHHPVPRKKEQSLLLSAPTTPTATNWNQTDFHDDDSSKLHVQQIEGKHPKTKIIVGNIVDVVDDETANTNTNTTPESKRGVAIVVNANAGGVTSGLLTAIQNIESENNNNAKIYVTRTLEEAQQAINDIKEQNPALVVPVGGDGTLTMCIESLLEETQQSSTSSDEKIINSSLPMFGYIALGTGNALGTVIGCNPQKKRFLKSLIRPKKTKRDNIISTLQRLIELEQQQSLEGMNKNDDIIQFGLNSGGGDMDMDFVDLPLMEMTSYHKQQSTPNKHYCFFAGVGFDSMMLQDYQDLQEWSKHNKFWKDRLSSVFGYCVTLATKTLPKCIGLIESDIDYAYGNAGGNYEGKVNEDNKNRKNKRPPYLVDVKITTNQPDDTVWIDHRRGDVIRRVSSSSSSNTDTSNTDTILYKGIAGIVAGSTTPYYGGNLRLFPFARMSLDKMQLRVGRIHPMRGVLNLPSIFRGSYRDLRSSSFGCIDFLSKQFTIEIDNNEDQEQQQQASNTNGQQQQQQQQHGQSKKGYPVQHSGESIGPCNKIDLKVLPDPIRFVTLLPPRIIHEEQQKVED